MKSILFWSAIVALVAVYVLALVAVLHPHVSPAYRAYFIDRTSDDYNSVVYDTTPEQGIIFSRAGLPEWVRSTHGFSGRDGWGRWTDENLGTTARLTFNQRFDGDVCVDTTIRAIPWVVGDTITLRMGQSEQPLRIQSEEATEYRVQLTGLQGAEQLDFVLPPKLPAVIQRWQSSKDWRRVGINVANLKLVPGKCSSSTAEVGLSQ